MRAICSSFKLYSNFSMCSTDFAEWLRLNKKPIRKWFVWLFFFPSRALIFGIHIAYALSALYYYNDNNLWWWLDSLNWQNYSWKMIICVCVNPWNKRIHSSPNLISLMMWLIHIHITTAKSGTHSNKALSLSLTAKLLFNATHTAIREGFGGVLQYNDMRVRMIFIHCRS